MVQYDAAVGPSPRSSVSSNPPGYLCSVCGRTHLYFFSSGSIKPVSQPVTPSVSQPVTPSVRQPVVRRKLPARICRSFRVSLRVPPQELKSADFISATQDGTSQSGRREQRIVDFLRFSHDVTLFRVGLPLSGTLEIRDRHFKTLRVATSTTGDFLLGEPLEMEAGKFYRMYLTSPLGHMDCYRGSSWKIEFGDVTVEWGNCTIAAGLDLWICD